MKDTLKIYVDCTIAQIASMRFEITKNYDMEYYNHKAVWTEMITV